MSAENQSFLQDPISIIIPAHNEEDSISQVLTGLQPLAQSGRAEIIVVNDGSDDRTAEVVRRHPFVRLINHKRNKGYGSALKTAAREAKHEWLLTFDADGQHKVEDIDRLLAQAPEADMVVGARRSHHTSGWMRRPGKWLLGKVANYLTGVDIPDVNSGLRLVRREYVEEFKSILPNSFSFSTTITLAMLKGAYEVVWVPIDTVHRQGGSSRVKQTRDGAATLLLITRCITLFNPLKVFAPSGFILILLGILWGLFGVVVYASFPKTALAFFLAGIVILFFGILADQIAAIRRDTH